VLFVVLVFVFPLPMRLRYVLKRFVLKRFIIELLVQAARRCFADVCHFVLLFVRRVTQVFAHQNRTLFVVYLLFLYAWRKFFVYGRFLIFAHQDRTLCFVTSNT
jgi:hypothetical protein